MHRSPTFAATPRLALALCISMLAPLAWAAPLQAGQDLPAMVLKDQHDKSLPVTADTRIIFFAAEMSASSVMAKALEGLPPAVLRDKNAVYIADISSMPQPISTIVAMPRMQKLPYPVAVIRHAADSAPLPRKPGAVTVLTTTRGRISAVSFADRPEQISAFLR